MTSDVETNAVLCHVRCGGVMCRVLCNVMWNMVWCEICCDVTCGCGAE